jgi:hypothetical protein
MYGIAAKVKTKNNVGEATNIKTIKMKKQFVNAGDIPKSALSEANRFLYNRVKLISSKLQLKLDSDGIEVGKELFIVSSPIDANSKVIPVICKGYEITSCFHHYDNENGIVDTECNPIFLDADGNEYQYAHSDIAFVELTREDAEERLEEMKSDLY